MELKNVVLKNGLLLSGATIAYTFLISAFGFGADRLVSSIGYIFIPIILYMAIKQNQIIKDNYSFGSSFGTGFKTTLIASIIIPIFTYIYLTYIDSETLEFIIAKAEDELYAQNLSDDQIEMALEWQKKILQPFAMAIFNVFNYLLTGTLISLIIAAIVKKKDTNNVY